MQIRKSSFPLFVQIYIDNLRNSGFRFWKIQLVLETDISEQGLKPVKIICKMFWFVSVRSNGDQFILPRSRYLFRTSSHGLG